MLSLPTGEVWKEINPNLINRYYTLVRNMNKYLSYENEQSKGQQVRYACYVQVLGFFSATFNNYLTCEISISMSPIIIIT